MSTSIIFSSQGLLGATAGPHGAYGEGLLVDLKEVLANRFTIQKEKAGLGSCCVQQGRRTADPDRGCCHFEKVLNLKYTCYEEKAKFEISGEASPIFPAEVSEVDNKLLV